MYAYLSSGFKNKLPMWKNQNRLCDTQNNSTNKNTQTCLFEVLSFWGFYYL